MTTNAMTLFEQPQIAPAYLQTSAAAKLLAEQMEGGLAGRSINRISLRNGKFRFNKQGVEVHVHSAETLDVVIVAANPAVGRMFYLKAYDSDAAGERPDCYSKDGVKPEADSPNIQSPVCATCPKNAVGSALNGKGKACSYKKRVVIVAPKKIDGDAYAIDVAAMGLFGEDDTAHRKFNLKSYIEALKANGLIVPSVVTRLSFDDKESVPKLFFTPVRVLTPEEFALVESRLTDPEIRGMLDDVDNKTEAGKPVGAQPKPLGPPLTNPQEMNPAPVQQVAQVAAPVVPAQQVAPTPVAPRRGRPAKTETPPAQAPAPTAAPATVEGFGDDPPATAAPAATAPGAFTVDLDEFEKFDA